MNEPDTRKNREASLAALLEGDDIQSVSRAFNIPTKTLSLWLEKEEIRIYNTLSEKEKFTKDVEKTRICTTKSIRKHAENKFNVSTRTAGYWQSEAVDKGVLALVKEGVYVNKKISEPVTLSEVSQVFYPNSVVSLDKVFDKACHNDATKTTIIQPYDPDKEKTRPKTGIISTAMGDIRVVLASKDAIRDLHAPQFLDPSIKYYRQASLEKSLVDAYIASKKKGRSYHLPTDIELVASINAIKMDKICKHFSLNAIDIASTVRSIVNSQPRKATYSRP